MNVAAGFGVADITPRMPSRLSGFASRDGLAAGALDPLTARALVLDDGGKKVALVALDLIGAPDDLTEAVRAELGPEPPALILAATHTHAGPPVLHRAMLGKPPAGYLDALTRGIVRAIRAAESDRRAARIERRRAATSGIAHNRRNADGPLDESADVVAFVRTGAPTILWVNFACHPVVLGPDNLSFSADFPGAAREVLAAATGAAVLYTTGCAGEINLGHSALDSIRRVGLEKRTPAEAERVGRRLAMAVIRALGQPAEPDTERPLAAATAATPARFVAPDQAARAALRKAALERRSDPTLAAGERAMAEIDLAWLDAPAAAVPALPVSVLRCGPVEALFLPGEIFVETALAIKARRPGAIVVGYAGLNPGYIPPATARGGYEVDVAWRPYGAPGPFEPGMAESLADLALSL